MGMLSSIETCRKCNAATVHTLRTKYIRDGRVLVTLGESECSMCGNIRAWSITSNKKFINRTPQEA